MEMNDEELAENLLLLIAESGRVRGRTRIQKLAFIGQQMDRSGILEVNFEFQPYFYGPYSPDLNRILAELIGRGLVEEVPYTAVRGGERLEGYEYGPTASGIALVEQIRNRAPEVASLFRSVADRFASVPLEKLLGWVYKEYPEMAILSLRE